MPRLLFSYAFQKHLRINHFRSFLFCIDNIFRLTKTYVPCCIFHVLYSQQCNKSCFSLLFLSPKAIDHIWNMFSTDKLRYFLCFIMRCKFNIVSVSENLFLLVKVHLLYFLIWCISTISPLTTNWMSCFYFICNPFSMLDDYEKYVLLRP